MKLLNIELVPKTAWYSNLRNMVKKSVWDKIRRTTYQQYGYKCAICESEGRMNCHEIWKYDDIKNIQYLKGFISLCDNCHAIKHLGRSRKLASEGKLNFKELEKHYCKVNKCKPSDFLFDEKDAMYQWSCRSGFKWKTNLGIYSHFLNQTGLNNFINI